jgi:Zn-dependent M28 family amino/carboxypeptidase
MQIVHSRKVRPVESAAKLKALLKTIHEQALRECVERISVPRSFAVERESNRATANWLFETFDALGYQVRRLGRYSNILALPRMRLSEVILVGAHYDSVPMCPGADDNGSAVAAMLSCAAACSLWRPLLPVAFVAFNCEEEGLKGSRDFVQSFLPEADFSVGCAHILEMVGYASSEPNSQRVPTGLPIEISNVGDFLGLLANGNSRSAMDFIMERAGAYVPELPVSGLNVKLGVEKFFPVLARSDHAPFWDKKIPAVMWTDTSEFRNHNYHRHTDTPDTLNYTFLKRITQLLTASVIEQAEHC